jgi:hypothetical protein
MAAEGGEQVAVAAEDGPGLVAEGDRLGAVEAVGAAGAGAAGAAFDRAGARALAAVEAAAAVDHRRLAAAGAPRFRSAAGCLHIVARRVAVPEPAAVGKTARRYQPCLGKSYLCHGVTPGQEEDRRFEQNMNNTRSSVLLSSAIRKLRVDCRRD